MCHVQSCLKRGLQQREWCAFSIALQAPKDRVVIFVMGIHRPLALGYHGVSAFTHELHGRAENVEAPKGMMRCRSIIMDIFPRESYGLLGCRQAADAAYRSRNVTFRVFEAD